MAHTMFLPNPTISGYIPSSPDPTPLRMLAFSVAEAALQPDPNSPSFGGSKPPPPEVVQRNPRWCGGEWVAPWVAKTGGAGNLWDLANRAKERKVSPSTETPLPSPPISPASYDFTVPANSPLASSIARHNESTHRPPHLQLSRHFPLMTRSAEPSPTKSTFQTLDQTRPPPEFVPRLSAEEFSAKSRRVSSSKHTRTKSDSGKESPNVPKPRPKLPSLAQIQAKLTNGSRGHRRGSSSGTVPQPRVARTNSDDSVEVLQAPTNERPSLAILSRRPPTPPSPPAVEENEKEPRLALFLRERTSGRLAMAATPPAQLRRPVLKVTPPSFKSRPAIPPLHFTNSAERSESTSLTSGMISPTETRFNLAVSTPPIKFSPRIGSPSSPSESIRSSCTASPTLSVPIITCTPAPQTVVRDGVEQESDEEEDDVVVFDGEVEEEMGREERERRGKEMKDRLMLRRQLD